MNVKKLMNTSRIITPEGRSFRLDLGCGSNKAEGHFGIDEGPLRSFVPWVGLAVSLDVSKSLFKLTCNGGGLSVDKLRKCDVDPLVEWALRAAVSLDHAQALLYGFIEANRRDLRRSRTVFHGTLAPGGVAGGFLEP